MTETTHPGHLARRGVLRLAAAWEQLRPAPRPWPLDAA